jgi:hypothetical protein
VGTSYGYVVDGAGHGLSLPMSALACGCCRQLSVEVAEKLTLQESFVVGKQKRVYLYLPERYWAETGCIVQ